MCRLTAYIGLPIALETVVVAPSHSLLEQAQHATEAKLAVNGDGFGVAWYDPAHETPGLYKDVLPAWSNGNLADLCRMIRSGLFLAHVRASTFGETARANCHPFRVGKWSFVHNGQIGGFAAIRRTLEADLPDALYDVRQGSTDSELLFLLLLANGLEEDPQAAIARVFARIAALVPAGSGPTRAALAISDGTMIHALRWSSDNHSPTLYWQAGETGLTLSSEPLDGHHANWTALPEGRCLTFTKEGIIGEAAVLDRAA